MGFGFGIYDRFIYWGSIGVVDWLEQGPMRRSSRRSNRGRVDQEHGIIREGLQAAGYYVFDTSAVGGDFPDLLVVSKADRTVLLEVKTDGGYPSEGQVLFLFRFPGPISLVFDIEQALEVMARYD